MLEAWESRRRIVRGALAVRMLDGRVYLLIVAMDRSNRRIEIQA